MNMLVTFLWKSEAPYNILWQLLSTDGACVALLFRLLLTENRLTEQVARSCSSPPVLVLTLEGDQVPRCVRPSRGHELFTGHRGGMHGRGGIHARASFAEASRSCPGG